MGKSPPSHPKHAAFVHLRPRRWNSEPIRAITMIFRRCGLLRAMRKQTHRHPQVISWVQDGTTVSLRSVVPYQHTYQHTHKKKKERKCRTDSFMRDRDREKTTVLVLSLLTRPFFLSSILNGVKSTFIENTVGCSFFCCFVRNKRFLLLLMR